MKFWTISKPEPSYIPPVPLLVGSTGIAIFMGALDGSIVNISLVTIARFFSVSMQEVRWVVLAYLVVLTAFLAFAGKLGDRYGNKLVFQCSFLIFGIGSLLCALAWTLPLLVAARAIQAFGAAGTTANGVALITQFTTPQNRGRAIGFNSLIVASALSIGPFLGGFMTEYFGWQSIFLINVPISVVGFISVQLIIPSSANTRTNMELDILGTLLFSGVLSCFVVGLTVVRSTSTIIIGFLLIGTSGALLTVLILWEQRIENPILDFDLFSDRRISLGIICAILAYGSLVSITFLMPFYLQDLRDLTPTETGLMILALPAFMSFSGPVAGYLSEKHDSRILSSLGLLGMSIMLIYLAIVLTEPSPPFLMLVIAMAISGAAMALFTSPNSNSIMSATPKSKLGLAGGFLGLARTIGFTLGITLSSTMFDALLESQDPSSVTNSVYTAALSITYLFFVGIAVLGVLLSIMRGSDKKGQLVD
ncbi:MAG: MFS transporter [Candidatus Hodarchaeota archaeon]